MAVKFEKIQQGATYYQRRRTKMGNTTLSNLSEWPVKILSIDAEKGRAEVVWNGNGHRPQTMYRRELESLFTWSMYDPEEAELVRGIMDSIQRVKRKKKAVSK